MPDWCFNNLQVRGGELQLAELREGVEGQGSPLDFERIDPTPPELTARRPGSTAVMLAALCGAAESEDPYAWRAAHWGCMGVADPESVSLQDSDDEGLSFRLSTPWSPPDGIAATLAARFPTLSVELSFFQPARGFAGAIAFEGGEEVGREECEQLPGVRELLERGVRGGVGSRATRLDRLRAARKGAEVSAPGPGGAERRSAISFLDRKELR